jgi:hypothetical protein
LKRTKIWKIWKRNSQSERNEINRDFWPWTEEKSVRYSAESGKISMLTKS